MRAVIDSEFDARSDARADDVQRAEQLVAQVRRSGSIELPELTDGEICALGLAGHAIVEADTWNWWIGLGASGQAALTKVAFGFLAERGLLDPESGTQSRVAPSTAFILAARSKPACLVLGGGSGTHAGYPLKAFGIAEEGRPMGLMVMEQMTDHLLPVLGRVRRYALVSTAKASRALASWLALPARPTSGGLPGGTSPRWIDVFRSPGEGTLTRERFLAHGSGTRAAADTLSVELVRQGGEKTHVSACPAAELAAAIRAAVEGWQP